MKKSNYNIAISHRFGEKSAKPVKGYIFSYNGYRFGVTNIMADGEKDSGYLPWTVSELKTGFKVICGESRGRAIERLQKMTDERWGILEKAVTSVIDDINPELMPKPIES